MSTQSRAVIARLPPYRFADLQSQGEHPAIQLAQNELGRPPSPRATAAASAALAAVNRYPDMDHGQLRQAIASVHGLDPSRILCGAGSLEIMGLIAQAYCEPGVEVVTSQYGYKFFDVLCTLAGAEVRVVAEPDMRIDIDALLAQVSSRTRIVFVVNPGNPTGAVLAPGELQRLHAALPAEVMLILDGAYAEFADGDGFDRGFDRVDGGDNLVVLRTFSKAYGLAGLRAGWCYAPAAVIDTLLRIRTPNSLNSAALAAAEAAVQDRDYLRRIRREVIELREAFIVQTREQGLVALPSSGNFVLIGCPRGQPLPAAELEARLRQRGIILRPMDSYSLDDYLRVTIGTTAEMDLLRTALAETLAGA